MSNKTEIQKQTPAEPSLSDSEMLNKLIMNGDVESMTPAEKRNFYLQVCAHMGISPLTTPFSLLKLNGKTQLYANRNCTDQLRSLRGISISITARDMTAEAYVVTAQAEMPSLGDPDRIVTDNSIGVVTIKGLTGDNLANAMMKAETKAKRRVTLSITGLSLVDQTETETIPGARLQTINIDTGEVSDEPMPEPQPIQAPVAAAPVVQQAVATEDSFTLEGPHGTSYTFFPSQYSWALKSDTGGLLFPKDFMPYFLSEWFDLNVDDTSACFAWLDSNLQTYGYKGRGYSGVANLVGGQTILRGLFDLAVQESQRES